ncbi:MAG TPA: NUDIX domain-containing protein [Candidatus Saccharimonadales bacterium]|nr:NUDIX domain-containing protein [Candidatus Saccharimonadales bacterium]
MDELWQLYDEQGQALKGKGAKKDDVFSKGILHAASHVWIWRNNNGVLEVLLQKRAAGKRTWPNRYDISAAGHIGLGETPLGAALREAKEEIDLTISSQDLKLFGVHRAHLLTENGAIENEFQWLYHLELVSSTDFSLQATEVESLIWVSMSQFKAEYESDRYVPHAKLYYATVASAIESAVQ